uniref:Putative secreted peptide n=1 Tax=Anopheles braziliensis TaxID=58242 RepID=A0A2M3ZXM6_9DIPT
MACFWLLAFWLGAAHFHFRTPDHFHYHEINVCRCGQLRVACLLLRVPVTAYVLLALPFPRSSAPGFSGLTIRRE